jgi:hypothetical protein
MKRVASVLVSWDGFRDPAAQAGRRNFAVDIAKYCRQQSAEVVLLPAGYLLAANNAEATARREAEALAQSFKGMSLAAGVDSLDAVQLDRSKGKSSKLLDEWTRKGTLPFWVFASDPTGNVLEMFRQRSTTSSNAGLMRTPSGAASQNRTVDLAGLRSYLLACGELFSPFIRQFLGSQQGLGLIAHLAHGGLGRTFPKTFPQLAKATGAWIINAQHVSNGCCWAADPGKKSAHRVSGTPLRASASSSGLWARIALWHVP